MPKVGNSSDWSSSEDDDGRDEDPVPSFDDITNSKRFPLNVHGTYTNWGPREAFRELIQNWYEDLLLSAFVIHLSNLLSSSNEWEQA